MRGWITALILLLVVGSVVAGPPKHDPERVIVLAVVDRPAPAMAVGGTPRGYAGTAAYQGSPAARAVASAVARDYQLDELAAWTIRALDLRCMLFRLPNGVDRDALLAKLREDRRVALAEPLRRYRTYSTSTTRYNDPYFDLQQGFSAIDAAAAQHWTRGEGVVIALIDTGVDAHHPELRGRIAANRDFVDDDGEQIDADRHGTEVAAIMAANANNKLGIVGVAPAARIDVFRACWPLAPTVGASQCNSFTLAQALGAAIAADARIINLSLGGPADPLLGQLLRVAIARGAIVVGAVPPDGSLDGFPLRSAGVLAVAAGSGRQDPTGAVLTAPGEDILTAVPGGHFDFASGSSLSAAHVSGVAALLLSLEPDLDAAEMRRLLQSSAASGPGAKINACRAVALLRKAPASACTGPASSR